MPSKAMILKREELYELVWSVSMLQLAKRFGISDRGLAKICKRLEIPVPGLGYWAKIAAGQSVERTLLSPLSAEGIGSVELNKPTESHEKINFDIAPEAIHPLITQTRAALSDKNVEKFEGRLVNYSSAHLNVQVSESQVDRAMQIANTLLNALEARGHIISIEKTGAGYLTWVSVDREKVSICLEESMGGTWGSDFKKSSYVPTGILALNIDYRGGIRRSWKDLKKQTLESFLGDFLESIARIQDEKKENRETREAYQLKKEKEDREAEERERRLKQQRSFLKKIEKQADYWERAEGIRRYLSALEGAIEAGEVEVADRGQMDAWLSAGRGIADQLDPITGGWDEYPPDFSEAERNIHSSYFGQAPNKPSYAPWWFVKKSKGWK